jgi:glycerol-1-phosphate dehydrogenase [NAD(P)+]
VSAYPSPKPFLLEEARVADTLNGLGQYALATSPEVWEKVQAAVRNPPTHLVWVVSMEIDALEGVATTCPEVETVAGLGGGSCVDTAKFVAWRRGFRLVQLPSIVSVDAAFTDAVGVRRGGQVEYVGRVLPERVVLDLDLISSAPPEMNRAGVGDVLSCHTGLFDWRLAAERGEGTPWDPALAHLGRELLRDLVAALPEIRSVTRSGLRTLAELQRRIGVACHLAGHSRFEEGSEHFLAYCYEFLTGRRHLHGELIALCTAIMARVQDNDPPAVARVIRRAGLRAHPVDLGIPLEDLAESLRCLPAYVRRTDLAFSVVDVAPPDERAIRDAIGWAADVLPRVPG